jgi:hypothetical protein
MVDSVQASVEEDTPFLEMFFCLFETTLASFLGLLVTAFFAFHIWLMTRAMTTIDFCEKSLKRSSYDNVMYDLGLWGNIKAVLGPNFFLFLLPLSAPVGDGLSFTSESTRLTADTQKGRNGRKKGHRAAQRNPHDPEGGGQHSVGQYAATEGGTSQGSGPHHPSDPQVSNPQASNGFSPDSTQAEPGHGD